MTREEHEAFIARMQPRVDAIYARHHRVVVVGPPQIGSNGPNGERWHTCGTCERNIEPNGRGGWRHRKGA